MQLANFFWILLIASGGFFLFFVLTIGYMLKKERKANKRVTSLQPAFQVPAPVPAAREFIVTQEQPVYYNTGQSQSYTAAGRTLENYQKTYENYTPQQEPVRRTAPVDTNPGRTTYENQQRFVIVNNSQEIRFR